MLCIELNGEQATARLGAAIAPLLRTGDAVLLEGPLGAGKSSLARALLRAAAGDAALDVPSPSFTLVQTYRTPRLVLHHLDLWRLDGPHALVELGWHELLEDAVLVEWPERLGALTPSGALHVALAYARDGAARRATLSGFGARLPALEEAFARLGDAARHYPA